MDMKLIPMRTKLDLAIFPIGDNFTMDIDDAIIASDFVECDKILGIHYDTFGYIKINHEEAIKKFFPPPARRAPPVGAKCAASRRHHASRRAGP